MAILGNLLKNGIKLRESLEQQYSPAFTLQKNVLRHHLIHTRYTGFGRRYGTAGLLSAFKMPDDEFYDLFKQAVPIYDYEKINEEWWQFARLGQRNICYPGKVKYFALSSGTSGASSKYIPVTRDMVKSIRKTSVRQLLSLSKYDLDDDFYTKGILMLGGSTNLRKHGDYFEGDLSGITASQIPFWFQHFYKPGKRIAKEAEWGQKLHEIVKKAPSWDIGIIVGVPAWLQILMEKIVSHYDVSNIHDIWPNLKIFVHGGVSFEPYRKGFEKLLGKPLIYMETYLASEGFIAFQNEPMVKSMKLVLNNGIFYEFVPFTNKNFTEDGQLKGDAEALAIHQVEEGKEYALLLTTNAGAWRYLIGDVIKFADLDNAQIVITGRTKHFLSLCGEHLSVDNMNKAVELTGKELNIDIREFTVAGEAHGDRFAHKWYIGTNDEASEMTIRDAIDKHLKELNDDYEVERQHALKSIELVRLPVQVFYDWMKSQGKEGGQNKFPRVLKNEKYGQWKSYLNAHNLI